MKNWKTIVALVPLVLAIIFNSTTFFTLLFIMGIIDSLYSGSVHYVETIHRWEQPVLYWVIIGIWAFLAVFAIIGG